MDTEVIDLMVETVEERFNRDVVAYKPSGENHRFILSMRKTVMLIDEKNNIFVPLKRGRSTDYLDLKRFLKEVKMEYRTRTEYNE